ncbi:MAG: EF-hand domain-containing protein [archaeon]|nr:EF-hand domain-containing protein [archaeon]
MDVDYKNHDKTYYAFISFIDDKGQVAFENKGVSINPNKIEDRVLVSGAKDKFTNITQVNLVIKDKKILGEVIFNKTFDFNSSNLTTKSPPSIDKIFGFNVKFNNLDHNHDNQLSIDEFEDLAEYIMTDSFWKGYSVEAAVIAEFKNLDIDNNGFLSLSEFSRRY